MAKKKNENRKQIKNMANKMASKHAKPILKGSKLPTNLLPSL
jgi:hypothetical protein